MPKISTEEAAIRFAQAAASGVLVSHDLTEDWSGSYERVAEALAGEIDEARRLFESRVIDEYHGLFDREMRQMIERQLGWARKK